MVLQPSDRWARAFRISTPLNRRERTLAAAFAVLLAYLVGSFPTGVVMGVLWRDIDVREAGSGNIGATNVARLLGARLGGLTLLGDLFKGLLPVLVAPLVLDAAWYVGLVGLAAFLGHCYSIFLEFKGGKGVATAAGVLLGVAPLAMLGGLAIWGAIFAWRRTSSLAGLAAAAVVPVLVGLLSPEHLVLTLALCLGIFLRHIPNIRRLLAGTEAAARGPAEDPEVEVANGVSRGNPAP